MSIDDVLVVDQKPEVMTFQSVCGEIARMANDVVSMARGNVLVVALAITTLQPLNALAGNTIDNNDGLLLQVENMPLSPVKPMKLSLDTNHVGRQRTERQLQALRELPDGWDGENALRPDAAAVGQAAELLSNFDDEVLAECALFPSNDAGVFIRGRLPKGKFTMFLDGKRVAYVIKGDGAKLSATVELTPAAIDYINQGFSMYV